MDWKKVKDDMVQALIYSGRNLSPDVKKALDAGVKKTFGKGCLVMNAILENLELAEKNDMPICQDTGMVIFFVRMGTNLDRNGISITSLLEDVVETAYNSVYFRRSVVADPLKDRKNTGTNTPPLVYFTEVDGHALEVGYQLKGFGCENCSRTIMLKPTSDRNTVIDAVVNVAKEAGGLPCPPVVLGVGIGGSMDWAARISKEALLGDLGDSHPDNFYAEMEKNILTQINNLDIGPGGLGGGPTALGVKIKTAPTHIAGMPVAVSVNCWADRKGILRWEDNA